MLVANLANFDVVNIQLCCNFQRVVTVDVHAAVFIARFSLNAFNDLILIHNVMKKSLCYESHIDGKNTNFYS
jgi:hypothetical protein